MDTWSNTRKMKVYYGFKQNSYAQIPIIRLGGDYLTSAGFKIGDTISITLEKDKISITKLLPSEAEAGSAGEQPDRNNLV